MPSLQLENRERAALVNEIHHRVKNNLAVVSSLLHMKASSSQLPEVKTAISSALGRIRAIAVVHEHVYSNANLEQVDFSDCIQDLVSQISTIFDRSGEISISVEASSIRLDVTQAVPCAIIMHELLANTFTHAFPGSRAGEVFIHFREVSPQWLELTVADDGVGYAANPLEVMESSGLEIIEVLARQLGGFVERELECGTRTVVRFPR